jgi:hypothetical protein
MPSVNAAPALVLGPGRLFLASFVRHVAKGSPPAPAREDEPCLLSEWSGNCNPTLSSPLSSPPSLAGPFAVRAKGVAWESGPPRHALFLSPHRGQTELTAGPPANGPNGRRTVRKRSKRSVSETPTTRKKGHRHQTTGDGKQPSPNGVNDSTAPSPNGVFGTATRYLVAGLPWFRRATRGRRGLLRRSNGSRGPRSGR